MNAFPRFLRYKFGRNTTLCEGVAGTTRLDRGAVDKLNVGRWGRLGGHCRLYTHGSDGESINITKFNTVAFRTFDLRCSLYLN